MKLIRKIKLIIKKVIDYHKSPTLKSVFDLQEFYLTKQTNYGNKTKK